MRWYDYRQSPKNDWKMIVHYLSQVAKHLRVSFGLLKYIRIYLVNFAIDLAALIFVMVFGQDQTMIKN